MSPRSKTKAAKRTSSQSSVTVDRETKSKGSSENFIDKIQTDLEKNQSYLNLILGALIVIVLGVLIFNYFNKPAEEVGDVGPSQQQVTDAQGDVTKEALPGNYTVKEGDTLFLIAQKYYDDGNLYAEITRENNLTTDSIEVGQVLNIPKLALAASSPEGTASASPEAITESTPSPEVSIAPIAQASMAPSVQPSPTTEWGTGGAENQTTWGEKITGDTYTVVAGDWLSTISGRAYGDIMMYEKIAQANNIADPNIIEVGTVLKIPRN